MNKYVWLDDYLAAKPGALRDYKAEWRWDRWLVGGKMFAARCCPDKKYTTAEPRELVTLKCEPLLSELLQKEYPDVIPGFYMDKTRWLSVYLDGDVPEDVLRGLCDRSYALVLAGLTKKLRKEIAELG